MSITKTLGGDRLGAGNKMEVDLHGYDRSTHDMGYLWRSTMSAGTLVPFLVEVALPGDTFDINLDCNVKTHPTIGPLFGSYKVQLDVFLAPIRLYNAYLHNNKLGIGMNMSKVKLPIIKLRADEMPIATANGDVDNAQINPSALLAYLGIRGVGYVEPGYGTGLTRDFNAVPLLAYWEIYKNYYANKQETNGYVLHSFPAAAPPVVNTVTIGGTALVKYPATPTPITLTLANRTIIITCATPPTADLLQQIKLNWNPAATSYDLLNAIMSSYSIAGNVLTVVVGVETIGFTRTVYSWDFVTNFEPKSQPPRVVAFGLSQIDMMRERILSTQSETVPFDVTAQTINPYEYIDWSSNVNPLLNSQEGLGLKTYQSDLFNNWLSTEWIDGVDGITQITAIDTSSGEFTIDTLNLSKKVYDMLNRIAVSGGSYGDWINAAYAHTQVGKPESPVYMGGLSKELVFQEVVSNSESPSGQPLGTLAGKGIMGSKHKGGTIRIKVDEPSYVMGIVSLTPRIDYSQGNKWDTGLKTLDDLHKPALDEIGFQELIIEQMAWWATNWNGTTWVKRSAGKQPAWINYMTNVNKTYGNFAIANNEMFMTLNRRYKFDRSIRTISDLTTYVDPSKYNFIFADTALDSQNFWTQIAVDMEVRRKMSAKVMPNL